jgi:outer membrane lipoprotein carrier protein
MVPRSVLAAVLLLVAPVCLAWTESWTSIRTAAQGVNTLAADFTQSKQLKMLAHPIRSEGKLYYQRPGNIRWEYTSPIKSVLISTKQGVVRLTWRGGRYQPDADAKLKPVQMVMAQLEHWLSGDFSNTTLFVPTLEAGPPRRVKLTPRDQALSKFITAVYVTFSTTPGVVDTIEIWEGPDAVTRIQLKNAKVNQPLPARTFQPPA